MERVASALAALALSLAVHASALAASVAWWDACAPFAFAWAAPVAAFGPACQVAMLAQAAWAAE